MRIFLGACVPAVTIAVLLLFDPMHLPVSEDFGIFLYSAGAMAEGILPPRVAFDINSGSLAYVMAAVPMRAAELMGLSGVIGFRAASLLVTAFCVSLTGYIALQVTRSGYIAATSSAMVLLATTWLTRAANGLEPKTTMLLFGLLCLVALERRADFWTGFSAMAAGLAWRPGWIYLGVVIVILCVQAGDRGWRGRAGRVALGALGLLIPYLVLYASQGALGAMWSQSMLAPLAMGRGAGLTPPGFLVAEFVRGFPYLTIWAVVAFVGIVGLIWKYARKPKAMLQTALRNPAAAGLLLSAAAYGVFIQVDFQGAPDWIPIIPTLVIAAAWSGWTGIEGLYSRLYVQSPPTRLRRTIAAVLLAIWVGLFYLQLPAQGNSRYTWQHQAEVSRALAEQLGSDAHVVSLGNAELLYFMHRHNFDDVIHVHGNYPSAIDQIKPGGFAMYLERLEATEPVLVVVGRVSADSMTSGRLSTLAEWLNLHFVRVQSCLEGDFYVSVQTSERLFPIGKRVDGCFRRA